MKPSEFALKNKMFLGKQKSSVWSDLKKMDLLFINKEELKEKINIKFKNLCNKLNDNKQPTFFSQDCAKAQICMEILKLLEE